MRVGKLALVETALVAALTACSAGAPPQRTPGAESPSKAESQVCGDPILTDEGIGALRIGMPVSAVRIACSVLRDTIVTDMEGMPSRRVTIAVGADSAHGEIVDDKLWRVSVVSPGFRTADSLGVGSSIARFKSIKGAHAVRGEGAVYAAIPSHCGMSFQLTGFKPASGAVVLANLPPSVTVLRVFIFGCPSPAGSR